MILSIMLLFILLYIQGDQQLKSFKKKKKKKIHVERDGLKTGLFATRAAFIQNPVLKY